MLNYLKLGGAALIVAALLYGGWAVNGWRLEAQAAEVLRLELRNELQRRIAEQVRVKQADDARLAAEAKLSAKEAEIAKTVKTVKETIVKYVPKSNPECDIPEPVASQLQHLRSGGD
jgi:hypothetical protein